MFGRALPRRRKKPAQLPNPPHMTAGPSTEQLLVQVLLRSMQELLRALRLEEGDAPARAGALQELRLAFAPVWHRLPYLGLHVRDDRIEWEGHTVLEAAEDRQGFASALSSAGIESLMLVPGVEETEALRFLIALDRARTHRRDAGPDLLTMLFQEDLQYLRYTVAPPADEELPTIQIKTVVLQDLEAGVDRRHLRDAVREDAEVDDRARGVVRLEEFDSTLYFLDQREIEYLQDAIDREYQQDHARNALALLLDILQLRSEPAVRQEVIGILQDLMPFLLGSGRFGAVAYLISEIRVVAREARDVTPDQKDALDALRTGVSEPEAIAQLFHALEDGRVEPTQESLGILLRELRPKAIRRVLAWLDVLTKPEAKAVLRSAVDAFFTEWPTALSRMLSASDESVVHTALDLAMRLKHPDFADAVAKLTDSEDGGTRERVAHALAAIGSGPALRALMGMAEDEDSDVRGVVYRAIAERRIRGAAGILERALSSRDLERRGLRERRALFRAYGTVAGASGVPKLEPFLRSKGPFSRGPSSETRACAAVALGLIGTGPARAALRDAAEDRDPVVRSAAGAALRGEE